MARQWYEKAGSAIGGGLKEGGKFLGDLVTGGAISQAESVRKGAKEQRKYLTKADEERAKALAQQEQYLGEAYSPEALERLRAGYTGAMSEYDPYATRGQEAFGTLASLAGQQISPMGAVDVTQDPGYQFRMQQGMDALEAQNRARGRSLGGAAQKELLRYGQDLASQEYGSAYARKQSEYDRMRQNLQDRYNRLQGIAGFGERATGERAGLRERGAGAESLFGRQRGTTFADLYGGYGSEQAQSQLQRGDISAGRARGMAEARGQGIKSLMDLAKEGAKALIKTPTGGAI